MTIAAVLRNRSGVVITLGIEAKVGDVVRELAAHRIGAVPIVRGDAVAGIVSERDVIRCLAEQGAAVLERPVAEVMTTLVQTVSPADPVIGALSLMTQRRIRHLPVVEDGGMIGLVSIGDLVKYRIDRIEADAAAMRDYIQSA